MTHLIKVIKYSEMYEEIVPLNQAHWDEVGSIGGPKKLDMNYEYYFEAEKLGSTVCLGCFVDNKLVGYITSVLSQFIHNAYASVCVVDAIYIMPEYRGHSMAKDLMNSLEDYVRAVKKVHVMYVSSNLSFDIGSFLKRLGYQESEVVYQKNIGE